MPKCDTWPSHIGLESLSNMNSAGSCDSVISMNSGCSEDSMEHLSPEERACLMYLEETIEALEVQEDSGFSNDELDLREPINDYSGLSNESGRDQRSFLNHGSPTPLSHPVAEPVSAQSAFANLTPNSEPQDPSDADPSDPPTVESLTSPTVGVKTTSTNPKMPGAVIPPPSDFMDNLDSESRPERVKYHPPSVPAVTRPGLVVDVEQLRQRAMTPTVNVEQLRQRAASRRTSLSPPPSEKLHIRSPSNMSLTSANTSTSNLSSPLMSRTYVPPSPPRSPLPESPDPRSPPSVAPKPKMLPANILLKSHKAAEADRNSGHLLTPTSERKSMDHHRVHMEALQKLGLLRTFEEHSDPGKKTKFSTKTRYSWAAPSLPISQPASTSPLLTGFHSRVNSFPQAVPSSTAPSIPPSDILPAPPAFSDPTEPLHSYKKYGNDFTPSALISQLPRKSTNVKSVTLERSGVGLSSYLNNSNSRGFGQSESSEQMPNRLSGDHEYLSDYEEETHGSDGASTDSEVYIPPYPAPQHPEDLQDLPPRSQGVSVVISPHAENENDRREALRKLGLLKD